MFDLSTWLIPILMFLGLIYLVVKSIAGMFGGRGSIKETGTMICPACGARGEPKIVTRGNLAIEIILWLCLIIPGLIYSIWRLTSRIKGCPSCGQTGMIPVNSPVGKRLAQDRST